MATMSASGNTASSKAAEEADNVSLVSVAPPQPATPAAPKKAPLGDQLVGMLFVLSSTFAFSLMALCVNLLGDRMPSFESVFFRFLLQGLGAAASIALFRRAHIRDAVTWLGKAEQRRMLIIRGLWGIGGMSSYFAALSWLSLSDANALSFVNVPLTGLLAAWLLKEGYTVLDGVTAVLSMVGVVCVAQPPALFGATGLDERPVPWYAVLVALFGAVCSSMAYISVRRIGKDCDALVIVLWFAAVGTVISPFLGLVTQGPFIPASTANDALLLVALGLTGFLGQALLNRGIQLAPAGPAIVMRYADVVFSLLFQSVLLKDPPGALKLVGVTLIMSCLAATYAKERNKRKAAKAKEAAEAQQQAAKEQQSPSVPPHQQEEPSAATSSSGSSSSSSTGRSVQEEVAELQGQGSSAHVTR